MRKTKASIEASTGAGASIALNVTWPSLRGQLSTSAQTALPLAAHDPGFPAPGGDYSTPEEAGEGHQAAEGEDLLAALTITALGQQGSRLELPGSPLKGQRGPPLPLGS